MEEKKPQKNTQVACISQDIFVSLHHDNGIKKNSYGTDNYSRTRTAAEGHYAGQRYERLGVHAVQAQGRPTLGSRWDTLVYEEGLPSGSPDDRLGNARAEISREAERLIEVAKKVGDYIPSTIWETFGDRENKPSGESIVFLDERNKRVVKFKDPFAYVSLKNDNPYHALYEHHIHNHFFGDASYRLLGVSQDPVSGGVRFAFEQPFIYAEDVPTEDEIKDWFKERGFELTPDGFWYTDGYVSFTDVWGDNCIKDDKGDLHFIDPIIKFEQAPKQVIEHYIQQQKRAEREDRLSKAGITVGSRFRIDRLCSDNDLEITAIDLDKGTVTFRHPYSPEARKGNNETFSWPLDGKQGMLSEIMTNRAYRWIQTDEDRNDIVIPQAKAAIMERAKDKSRDAAFTDAHVAALERYTTLFPDHVSRELIFRDLVEGMRKQMREELVPDRWIDDVRDEAIGLASGERREQQSVGLSR